MRRTRWSRPLGPTTTISDLLPDDPRQCGEVVALRLLPLGQPIILDTLCDSDNRAPKETILIGTSPDADIQLKKKRKDGLSRTHCLIHRSGVVMRVEDTSKHGTYIARTRILKSQVEVFPGQVLELGRSTQLLLCNDALAACPADIIASNVDAFYQGASRRYRFVSRITAAIGGKYETHKKRYRKLRTQGTKEVKR